MTTMEDVFCKAKAACETVGKKTGEQVGIIKLKIQIAEAQKRLEDSQRQLGQIAYEQKNGGDISEQTVETCMDDIRARKDTLEELRRQLNESQNRVVCAACGEANTMDSAFCKNCGAKL